MQSIVFSVSVCLSVLLLLRLYACVLQKPYVQMSRNFLYMLPMDVALSDSDNSATCYAVLDLWM